MQKFVWLSTKFMYENLYDCKILLMRLLNNGPNQNSVPNYICPKYLDHVRKVAKMNRLKEKRSEYHNSPLQSNLHVMVYTS